MEIGGSRVGKRAEAGQRLKALLGREAAAIGATQLRRPTTTAGSLGGFPVTATVERNLEWRVEVILRLQEVPNGMIVVEASGLSEADPTGLVTRLEHRLFALEQLQADNQAEIERLQLEAARAREGIGLPFPHQEQLARTRDHVRRLAQELETLVAEPEQDPVGQDAASPSEPANLPAELGHEATQARSVTDEVATAQVPDPAERDHTQSVADDETMMVDTDL
jgi:hypothetical protein